uniref:Inner centromere protein ARK-binding domain-containing protein n=1 Tax=Arion vulgaris TaxID=1028688 RepID=A0A0B7AJ23_9EUPU
MIKSKKNKINKKFEEKAIVKEKLLEERSKEEREKQRQRLKKQMDADSRRKMEEEERLKKLLELEEETKMHNEFMQRKKEFEEAQRRQQIADEKKKQEERLAEFELKRQEDIARLRQAEDEKDKERERLRLEKEKYLANERTERDRIEREKREEKERKIQEELERLRAMEKERFRCQQEKLQQQKQEEAQQNVLKHMIDKHNSSVSTSKQASTLNTVNGAINISNNKMNSYDLTPVKAKVISNNKDPETYDIEDKNSDDSTDDEEAPRKRIPEWAMGIPLNTALIRQDHSPPDFDKLFRIKYIKPINLTLVFPGKKKPRYNQRTSSAIWNSPPLAKH